MLTFASVCFLLTILRIDAKSAWFEGFDEIKCKDNGACQCIDTISKSVFLDWTENIESCTCFRNENGCKDNPAVADCTPKCRSDGWYDVEQLCYDMYFCSNKKGELIEGTNTTDANELDCSMFADDDNEVTDAVELSSPSSEDNDQSPENNSDETEPGDSVDSESDGDDSGDSEYANNEESITDESNDNNEESTADGSNDSYDANNEKSTADGSNDSYDANNEESTADGSNDSYDTNNGESTADETNDGDAT